MKVCTRRPIYRELEYKFMIAFKYIKNDGRTGAGTINELSVKHYANEKPFICHDKIIDLIKEKLPELESATIYDIQIYPTQ